MTKGKAEVWGPVIASLLAGAGEVTRAAIAARLRSTAADLERGEIVSDAAIDAALDVADRIARAQNARK
jgi:hypothetical protein